MKQRTMRQVLALPILIAAIACGSTVINDGPSTGDDGQACYANGTCNSGLTCANTICVSSPDGGTTGADADVDSDGRGTDSGAPIDSGETPDAAPIDVGSIPGLQLWVDAAKKVTIDGDGGVTVWGDQSPAANDLQSTPGKPYAQAVVTAINGLPTIHGVVLSGTYSSFDTGYAAWGDNEFFIEAIESVPLGHGAGLAVGFENSVQDPGFDFTCIGAYPQFVGADFTVSGTVSVNDGVPRLIGIRKSVARSGATPMATMSVRVNGVEQGTNTRADESVNPPSGGATHLMRQWDGDISEIIIVVATSIPDEDILGVEQYLKTKYAL